MPHFFPGGPNEEDTGNLPGTSSISSISDIMMPDLCSPEHGSEMAQPPEMTEDMAKSEHSRAPSTPPQDQEESVDGQSIQRGQ